MNILRKFQFRGILLDALALLASRRPGWTSAEALCILAPES
jgi:hypothetical protein